MADFPSLPLWTDAYLADTMHLTYEEHGLYLMLLIHLWRSPELRFPNDDQWLARKFRMTVDEVQSKLRPIIEEFCKCDGNWIRQKRLGKEFDHIKGSRQKQSARAKSGWQKRKGDSHGNAERHDNGICQTDAASGNALSTPTPTPTPSEETKQRGADAPDATAPAPDLSDLKTQLYHRGRQVLGKSAGGQITKLLTALEGSVPRARAAIETAATKDDAPSYVAAVIRHRSEEVAEAEGPRKYTAGML